jgi:tRNA(fMet)-specific endonuclease VapC
MILLDTNVFIDALDSRRPIVRRRLGEAQAAGEALGLSSVVLFELRFGLCLSARRSQNERTLQAVLNGGIEVVAFDGDDAKEAAELRAALRRAAREIGPYDLLIAAQARRRGATLVTHNMREFSRVPGLIAVDWVD